jgi:O-antigen/teichoic acid export membrane protein
VAESGLFIQKMAKKITDNKFLINFGWLNLSSLINKLISFCYVIALVRLLPQSSFGIYNLVWAHLGIMGGWQDLGTTPYGLLQNEKINRQILNNILSLRIILAFLISIITISLAIFFAYSAEIVRTVILFSGLYLYTASVGFFLIICSIKKKLFYPSVMAIAFNTILVASNLLVLFHTHNVFTVFKITALYYLLYGLLLFFVIKRYFFNFRFRLEKKQVLKIFKNSFVFTLISFFASVQTRADYLIINKLLGPSQLALYSAAHKFYDVPLLMVANYNFSSIPILKSLYEKNRYKYRQKIRNDVWLLLSLSLVIVLATWALGGLVINTFFSDKYAQSVPVLKVIILNLPLVLVTSVFLNGLYAQNKQAKVVYFFGAVAVLNIVLNYSLIPILGIMGAATSTVFSYLALLISFSWYLLRQFKHEKS